MVTRSTRGKVTCILKNLSVTHQTPGVPIDADVPGSACGGVINGLRGMDQEACTVIGPPDYTATMCPVEKMGTPVQPCTCAINSVMREETKRTPAMVRAYSILVGPMALMEPRLPPGIP